VYLTSTVKLNLIKFHSGTIIYNPHSVGTSSAIQLLVDTDKMCINNALTQD